MEEVVQSLHSRLGATPTNGDGFGIGWYGAGETPGVFHSTGPAWNDRNLKELSQHIVSPLVFAHVRASTGGAIQQTIFYSTTIATLRAQYPDHPALHRLSDETRLVVSEPINDLAGAWNEVPDDVHGDPFGHFVVLCGYHSREGTVSIADPLKDNPLHGSKYYRASVYRLIGAVFLRAASDDSNFFVLRPKDGRKAE